MTMASTLLIPLIFLIPLLPPAESKSNLLSVDFYRKTCSRFNTIIEDVIDDKQLAVPTTAVGALRLHFHDCVVGGCNASILISSTSFNSAERDNDINHSFPSDAFDVTVRAKTKLELACPGVIFCADIVAEAARDLVVMVVRPFYQVPLGRRDNTSSRMAYAEESVRAGNVEQQHFGLCVRPPAERSPADG